VTAIVFHKVVNGQTSTANPVIVVSQSNIYCRLIQTGGGAVNGTQLDGSGGTYSFAGGGYFQVQPGTYKLYVLGFVAGNGSVESDVTYQ
jgi:hypothetical protein